MPTARLETFSDGVFAIAITLLVLELPVPAVGHGELGQALLDEWPSYAAYLVSFAVIGIIWINHHAVYGYVRAADRGLLFLNLNLLLWVALIPWPTRLLAEYMQAGGDNERVAALVYALTMTLMGFSFGAMWMYISVRPGVGAVGHLPATEVRARTRRFVIGAPLYALSIGLAAVSAPACLAVNALLAVYYAVPGGGTMAHVSGNST
jgi:TMEM175 potassium channel family protein